MNRELSIRSSMIGSSPLRTAKALRLFPRSVIDPQSRASALAHEVYF
jgi:hypothetical protein